MEVPPERHSEGGGGEGLGCTVLGLRDHGLPAVNCIRRSLVRRDGIGGHRGGDDVKFLVRSAGVRVWHARGAQTGGGVKGWRAQGVQEGVWRAQSGHGCTFVRARARACVCVCVCVFAIKAEQGRGGAESTSSLGPI